MKKLVSILFGHVLFVAIICFIVVSFFFKKPELVPQTEAKYNALKTLELFLKFLPAAVSTGFLVGVSVSLFNAAKGAVKRFRLVVITSLFCVFSIYFSSEVLLPVVSSMISDAVSAPKVFRTFLELGNRSYQDGHMDMALRYATEALTLDPNNEDARKLRENAISLGNATVDLPREKQENQKIEEVVSDSFDVNFSWNEISGRSAEELFEKSEDAEANGDWIDAHYYALLAAASAENGSTLKRDATLRAAHYWSVLCEPSEMVDSPEMRLFQQKKAAYTLMAEGDDVGAYFKFLEILNTNELARDDPDIKKFLKIVTNRVETNCFFTDELENLRRFENQKNVHFAIPKENGDFDIVFVRGITTVRENDKTVQYLRSLSIFSYDADGEFVREINVPYAKLFFEKVSNFSQVEKETFGIRDEFGEVPFLLLHGLDSTVVGKETRPAYFFADESQKNRQKLKSEKFVFALSKSDYSMICVASAGEQFLSPVALWSLFKRAQKFGFVTEIFGAQLLHLLSFPLFILIFFIFLAKIAWNNRVDSGRLFKFSWIFILPVITVLLFIAFSILNYVIRAISFSFVSSFGLAAVAPSLIVGIVALFYVSTSFIIHAWD